MFLELIPFILAQLKKRKDTLIIIYIYVKYDQIQMKEAFASVAWGSDGCRDE